MASVQVLHSCLRLCSCLFFVIVLLRSSCFSCLIPLILLSLITAASFAWWIGHWHADTLTEHYLSLITQSKTQSLPADDADPPEKRNAWNTCATCTKRKQNTLETRIRDRIMWAHRTWDASELWNTSEAHGNAKRKRNLHETHVKCTETPRNKCKVWAKRPRLTNARAARNAHKNESNDAIRHMLTIRDAPLPQTPSQTLSQCPRYNVIVMK